MSDELAKLRDALRAERIEPRRGAKEAAVHAALRAFDANSAAGVHASGQGIGLLARLRIAASAAFKVLIGRRQMNGRQALAGGVSLAVLTLAVVTAASLQNAREFSFNKERGVESAPALEDGAGQPAAKGDLDAGGAAGQENAVPAELPALTAAPAPAVAAAPAAPPTARDASAPVAEDLAYSGEADSAQADMPLPEAAIVSGLAAPQRSAAFAPGATATDAPAAFLPESLPPPSFHEEGRDRFEAIETNPVKVTAEEPVSTFSVDVDTASYSFVRAAITSGVLPPEDAVRVEELVNYFPYEYPGPDSREVPFRPTVSVMGTPWNPATRIVHIAIKGFEIAAAERPPANLVFLVDTSGSMDEPNKLPLLVNSLKLLLDTLRPEDTVSIVAYAGSAGTVLEPTRAAEKARIAGALENLWAGGSTAGGEGIRQAYALAKASFAGGGVNRVILATDGDFNVGITDTEELKSFVERERESGVFLSVLGFGRGNYNDELMQALAQNGNGVAAYIDTLSEARKVLVEEAGSTMFPIASDVKLQVEFNPAAVSEYRLIGYETRSLRREDFNNDRVDAGDIGSGHAVTALYEITPVGSPAELVDDLRYPGPRDPAVPPASSAEIAGGEYGFLKIRYKLPGVDTSQLIQAPIHVAGEVSPADPAGAEARFAAAVAAFGQILRGGRHTGAYGYDDVIALAQANKGADEFGYRAEFINLVRLAKSAAAMPVQRP